MKIQMTACPPLISLNYKPKQQRINRIQKDFPCRRCQKTWSGYLPGYARGMTPKHVLFILQTQSESSYCNYVGCPREDEEFFNKSLIQFGSKNKRCTYLSFNNLLLSPFSDVLVSKMPCVVCCKATSIVIFRSLYYEIFTFHSLNCLQHDLQVCI